MVKKDILDYDKPIPVILGGFVNGYGLVRSFSKKKIPCICLDFEKNLALYSKHSKGIICPNPSTNDFIDFLMNLGEKLRSKGVFYATYDNWLIPICKNRDRLEKFFIFPMSDWETINKCVNKTELYKIAEKNKIKIPKTFFLNNIDEIQNIENQLVYPCVIKPYNPTFFKHSKIGKNVLFITSKEKLDYWVNEIKKIKLGNIALVVQEFIKGDIENLYTLTSYSNKNFEIVAYSIGHKIRQYPPDNGTIISGKLEDVPVLFESCKKLVKILGFYGISNIEFKKGENGEFYLMEINPRPGKWTYSSTAAGLNIPHISYAEILGEEFKGVEKTKKELVWITLLDDLYFSIFEYKNQGYKDAHISFFKWIRSIKGKKIFGIYSLSDPLPGIMYTWRKIS